MKKVFFAAALVLAVAAATTLPVFAHCQIPCGIYDDSLRMNSMYEDIATIDKSIREIIAIGKAETPEQANQLTRWIINKDRYADKLTETVTEYFMAQRLKPVAPDDPNYAKYLAQLTTLHKLMVEAMKCKQTVDPAAGGKLKALAAQFDELYFGKTPHNHD